jgi:hypothetical protein
MERHQTLLILVAAAACGLAVAKPGCSNNFGTVYGDIGIDAPYMQSLSPAQGPKQGGTEITIQGNGFKDDPRLTCRFSRLDPNTERTVTKVTPAAYVSNTEITCTSPEWEEGPCPNCVGSKALDGFVFGHTGSPYLRTSSDNTDEIGVGDYIQLSSATVGIGAHQRYLTQYYEVAAIEACTGQGCYCQGTWEEDKYDVKLTFNGTGYPDSAPNSGFEQITANTTNCALYRYDKFTGGATDIQSPVPLAMRTQYGGNECVDGPRCSAPGWAAGTKITLSEPVYKINGRANVMFNNKKAYRASKFSCTDCKCAEGCAVTVSVTNDGKKYSGSGLGGQVWAGSGLSFSLKDIVPTVKYIDHGLPGYRDSTRIFGPASGGTTITVVGENFQDSPLLRCYFAGVTTLVKAEWISSEQVRCKTPDFFSRQLDTSEVLSFQDGSAKNPHTKVHVTNDGTLGDYVSEGEKFGHISQNPFLMDDGSKGYIWTFDVNNKYTSGQTGFQSNAYRSTCQAGRYPNEGMAPCWGAHHQETTAPIGTGAPPRLDTSAAYSAGNDVLFKYATCYDANPAQKSASLNLYSGTNQPSGKLINSTSTLAQKIRIGAGSGTGTSAHGNMEDGPLSYLELHLTKASKEEARLEVSICSGQAALNSGGQGGQSANRPAGDATGFCAAGTGSIMSKETIVVSRIDSAANTYYPVFFNTPTYMLAGHWYTVQIKHISGAEDTKWVYTDHADAGGYYANIATAINGRFKLQGYTCDGCRTAYGFSPTTSGNSLRFGSWVGSIEGGKSTYLNANTFRSMQAQEFRPTETGTITHAYLKLENVPDNGVTQSYVSIWITKHGKYGEYVCSVFGGIDPPAGHNSEANWANRQVCDTDRDGVFDNACVLGAVCDPNNGEFNGGCGFRGACTLAETAINGHRLRPQTGGTNGPCGTSNRCDHTVTLAPDHMKLVKGKTTAEWIEFEFATPVPIEKHTTYYLNAAVVGNIDISKEVIWHSGVAKGDGGAEKRDNIACPGCDATPVPDELRFSYTRDKTDWRWERNANKVLATKFIRCVSSAAQVLGFSTSGEKTGCCSARASPQGGDKGALVTITGRNFFPSDDLRCVFRNEDGSTGAIVPATVIDASYTKMTCPAPTMDPHKNRDCTNPKLCQGTVLVVTNDGFTVGPQYQGPKWQDENKNIPAYMGLNPIKFLFSDIFISPTGSDTVGDGTIARPYQTIQRGVDAANEYDQIILLPGYYTGLGNRGLRHHGKKIQLKAHKKDCSNEDGTTSGTDADLQNTIIDCQHAPDGFILNNNKDSDSPFAGHIDTQDIITKNCENLRIYDI